MKKNKKQKIPAEKKERTPEETIERKKRVLKRARTDIIIKIIAIAAFLVATFTFFIGVSVVQTDDMYPAVRQGDVAIYSRLGSPMNSDVVLYECDGSQHIGRVQAEAGTEINQTESKVLTIDGNMQPIQERGGLFYETTMEGRAGLKIPSSVPDGSYLILGDKRAEATDSRDFGYINKENIKGKVFTIVRRRAL